MRTWIKKEAFNFVDYLIDIKHYSSSTEKTYISNLLEAVKYIDIEKIDQLIVIDLMPYRLKIKKLSKKTIYKKISIFRSFVKYLINFGYKIKIKNDETISVSKTLPKPISDFYIKEVLKKVDIESKLIITLLYSLGLRISELEKLRLNDIQNGWVIIKGKGGKIRQLPLINSAKKLLFDYLKERDVKSFIFEDNGKGLSAEQLRYRVSKAFKEIGLKVTPHQLRHSFATEMLKTGAKITDISLLLGHSSLDSTQIYTKLNSEQKSNSYKQSHPLSQLEAKDV